MQNHHEEPFSPSGNQVQLVKDPKVYRPDPLLFSWTSPRVPPPKIQLWITVSLSTTVMLVVEMFVPPRLGASDTETFNIAWLVLSVVMTTTLCFMAFARHLHNLSRLMEGISTLQDVDLAVEALQRGRFSRFEEVWQVQTSVTRMFQRILKDHHSKVPLETYQFPPRLSTEEEFHSSDEEGVNNDEEPANEDDQADTRSMASAYSTEDKRSNAATSPAARKALRLTCDTPNQFNALRRSMSDVYRRRSTIFAGGPQLRDPDPLKDNKKSWDEVLKLPNETVDTSLLTQLLSQVRLGDDLTKVTLPVTILEPRSLLEKLSDLFVFPHLLVDIENQPNALLRMTAVMRWFVSGFHIKPRGVKKPYNPILGETFQAVFPLGGGDFVYFVSEQVSHHPPISVFRAHHHASGIVVVASYYPRSKLVSPNCGASLMDGTILVTVPKVNETYKLSWPSCYVSGVIMGELRLELVGDILITCETTNIKGRLQFLRQGWFDKTRDMMSGKVWRDELGEKVPDYVIDGQWHSVMYLYQFDSKARKDSQLYNRQLFFDGASDPNYMPVRPQAIPTTDAKPSRAVWSEVTTALREGNNALATEKKAEIEKIQRLERAGREAQSIEYFPTYFRIRGKKNKNPSDDVWFFIGKDLPATRPAPPSVEAREISPRKSDIFTPQNMERTVSFEDCQVEIRENC